MTSSFGPDSYERSVRGAVQPVPVLREGGALISHESGMAHAPRPAHTDRSKMPYRINSQRQVVDDGGDRLPQGQRSDAFGV